MITATTIPKFSVLEELNLIKCTLSGMVLVTKERPSPDSSLNG